MSNFVADGTTAYGSISGSVFPKRDTRSLGTVSPDKGFSANDSNIYGNALLDLKSWLRGEANQVNWIGFLEGSDPAPSGFGGVGQPGYIYAKSSDHTMHLVLHGSDSSLGGGGGGSSFYQTVQANGTDQTQRDKLNFSSLFTLSDSSSPSRTTVTLANTAVSAGSYTLSSITVDAQGRLTAASSGTPPTLQQAYTNGVAGGSPGVITLNHTAATTPAFAVVDDATPVSGALFAVTNHAQTTAYVSLSVDSTQLYNTGVADGVGATGYKFDTANALTDATAQILGIWNHGSELYYFTATGAMNFAADSSSANSASGQGRIRYNNSTHTFQVSVNGGAYADLATGSSGVSGSGTTGKIAKFTSSTAVGDSILTESSTVLTLAGELRLDSNADVRLSRASAGNLLLDDGGSHQPKLLFGGTSSSFTALYQDVMSDSTNGLFVFKADGSAFTGIEASRFIANAGSFKTMTASTTDGIMFTAGYLMKSTATIGWTTSGDALGTVDAGLGRATTNALGVYVNSAQNERFRVSDPGNDDETTFMCSVRTSGTVGSLKRVERESSTGYLKITSP